MFICSILHGSGTPTQCQTLVLVLGIQRGLGKIPAFLELPPKWTLDVWDQIRPEKPKTFEGREAGQPRQAIVQRAVE